VHAPGTLFNNQFGGSDPWGDYFQALETSIPPIRAIAITDYYLTDTYEYVRDQKKLGRLKKIDLIFPNVELRLDIGTIGRRQVNAHLLVSPEDPEHLLQLHRFLARLSFRAHEDTFACTREDLIRLGKAANPALTDERAALRFGANQYKVNLNQLRDEYGNSAWARDNILIAVAGGQSDGTSGVRDSANATLRQEIEKLAHVIFASSVAQREFWLGRKDMTAEQLATRYGGLKPCLHGSDAHANDEVGTPDNDRFSWIKGDLQFDSLRQACIDPAGRACVGARPPLRATPSQVITHLEITGAPWATTSELSLNPGLVAIIGARGSGKTALADAIAAGCDATSGRLSRASFIVRARDHLQDARVKITWETGPPSERKFAEETRNPTIYPRARYLSQKFVEELSSADGMTDELLKEIERVIFKSHSIADQDGATDFDELLELKTSVLRTSRSRNEDSITSLSDRIGQEYEKSSQVEGLRSQIHQKRQLIANYQENRTSLVASGSEERLALMTELTEASEYARTQIRLWSNISQALRSLQGDVIDFLTNRAPEALRATQEAFRGARLTEEEWENFKHNYVGDVDATLAERLRNAEGSADAWRGLPVKPSTTNQESHIPENKAPKGQPLTILEAEVARLQRLISVDTDTAKKFNAISNRIIEENVALERLMALFLDYEQANDRIKELQAEREASYERIFEAVVEEEKALHDLYGPLMARLADESGTLAKLSFSVSRHANVHQWASEGEGLFDLRRHGPFKGVGTLEAWAVEQLKSAWENGDPQSVSEAMNGFRNSHLNDLLELSSVPRSQRSDYRGWVRRFAKWLYSTRHIDIKYSIDYEGVDIRKLSPGTRGIVLLLLYLALDDADDRPLIIDQPEENLDPKSIFDELVQLFVSAKEKRQVIMVTHNANLVVNTDADQVIIASAGTHAPGELPSIKYTSGGLESGATRQQVCSILEGGEAAFKERARRLRVKLQR
jgi:ABC-type lipoprotein export system ATPase subunit